MYTQVFIIINVLNSAQWGGEFHSLQAAEAACDLANELEPSTFMVDWQFQPQDLAA